MVIDEFNPIDCLFWENGNGCKLQEHYPNLICSEWCPKFRKIEKDIKLHSPGFGVSLP